MAHRAEHDHRTPDYFIFDPARLPSSIMAALASTTRRDFLRGRPLADAVAHAVRESRGPTGERWTESARAADSTVISASRRAMACTFEIILPIGTPRAVEAATAALDEVDRLEDQLTVYRDTSEVSRVNQFAATTPVPVEERLFGLFETALRLTNETEGAFDIAAGALVKAWGFFRGPKRVPADDELARVLERVGSRHIVLDRARRTIEFRRPGVEINLGAIGKGYALDRAADILRSDWAITPAVLHGGRSSVLAIGEKGVGSRLFEAPSGPSWKKTPVPFFSGGWLVGIVHPFDAGRHVATVLLRDAALGTSGATIQYFEAKGRRFGHILDPRTGWPAGGQACVSAIAPTAAEADALSTAFFILGPEKTREFCEPRPEIGAVVVSPVGESHEVVVQSFGRARGLVETLKAEDQLPNANDS